MQLYTLLEDNAKTSLENLEITGLTDDSRKVQSGMVFACIRGERFDGHTAAAEALEKGAAAVLVDHDLGLGDRQILTEDTRALYGKLCAAWFGHPERSPLSVSCLRGRIPHKFSISVRLLPRWSENVFFEEQHRECERPIFGRTTN